MLATLAGLLRAEELATLDSVEMGIPLSRSRRGVASSAAFLDWYAADGPRLHDRELAAVGDDLLNGPRAGRGRRRFGLVLAAPPALRAIDSR
jgi:acyl-CoA reductase-like NAD-dependent aldehyde dehydrogenase